MLKSQKTGQRPAPQESTAPEEGAWKGRRRYPRTNVQSEFVTAELGQDDSGFVIEISEAGMLVETMAHLNVKEVSQVRIDFPGREGRFAATGMVAWVGPAGRTGIQFVNVPESARALLKEWLSARPVHQAESYLPAVPVAATESPADALAAARRDAAILLLALTTERAASTTHADGAALAAGTGMGMCCCARFGNAPGIGTALSRNSGLSGVCLRTAKLVQCNDTESDPRVNSIACRELNLRSLIIVPILSDGTLRGVLELFSSKPYGFDFVNRQYLESVAQSIAPLLGDISWEKIEQQYQHPSGEVSSPPTAGEASAVSADANATPPIGTISAAQERAAAAGALRANAESAWAASQIVSDLGSSVFIDDTTLDLEAVAAVTESQRRSATTAIVIAILVVVLGLVAVAWYVVGIPRILSLVKPAAVPSATQQKSAAPVSAEPEVSVLQGGVALAAGSPGPAGRPAAIAVHVSRGRPAQGGSPRPAGKPAAIAVHVSRGRPAVGGSPGPAGQPADIVPGKLVHMVQPVYPAAARATNVQGTVVLTAVIDTNGFVENAKLLRGSDLLAPAAIDAIQQWLYEPYRLHGRPVAVETTFSVSFASASH